METEKRNMPRKIALNSTGPLSGKTALAKELEQAHGFFRVDHSRTLVENFVWEYNISWVSTNLTVEDVYADKECWRPQLQAWGNKVGYNDPAKSEYWIRATLHEWLRDDEMQGDVVFDSFRGEEQAEVLRRMGFTLVQLHIPENIRQYRAAVIGMPYNKILENMDRRPEIERGIKKPDVMLVATMPVPNIARFLLGDQKIRRMIRERQG